MLAARITRRQVFRPTFDSLSERIAPVAALPPGGLVSLDPIVDIVTPPPPRPPAPDNVHFDLRTDLMIACSI